MQFNVFVRDLVLPCRLGITASEQGVTQDVRFTVEMATEHEHAPKSLTSHVDYAKVVDFVKALSKKHIDLVEDYAEQIGNHCLAYNAVKQVKVCVEKLDIIEEAGSVGVEVVIEK